MIDPVANAKKPVTGRMVYRRQEPTPGRVCVDCLAEGTNSGLRPRPAPHPGPRCHTHHNAKKRDSRIARKVRHVERNFQISAEEYDALYAFQGGKCALCPRTGTSGKRLAVDHDHHQAMLDGHAPDKGCPKCIRGLVCSTCNDVLAHARSSPDYFARGREYLLDPPWKRLQIGGAWRAS
jgi:hypothetical protein